MWSRRRIAAVPTRTCVGCRATGEKAELTRIALVEGVFVVDAAQRLPGRGAYLHPQCAAAALRTRRRPGAAGGAAGRNTLRVRIDLPDPEL